MLQENELVSCLDFVGWWSVYNFVSIVFYKRTKSTLAEMVYGTTLNLPGDFLVTLPKLTCADLPHFVSDLHEELTANSKPTQN